MTKRQDVILCDIDGVICDFANEYLHLLKMQHGIRKVEADITTFHFEQCVSTPEQNASIWRYIERSGGFVYDLPMYNGALEFLSSLRQRGRVVACTSPANPTWTAERTKALQDHFGFSKRDIVVASDKSLIIGDFLIDDAVHNCQEWQNGAGMGGFALLFDRPWNASAPADTHWQRVLDYEHALETLDELLAP